MQHAAVNGLQRPWDRPPHDWHSISPPGRILLRTSAAATATSARLHLDQSGAGPGRSHHGLPSHVVPGYRHETQAADQLYLAAEEQGVPRLCTSGAVPPEGIA